MADLERALDPIAESADDYGYVDYEDDDDDGDASGCRDCGAVLLDDLDDFVERMCFSCAHRAYLEEPVPWGYRLRLLLFQVRTWPVRLRIRREIAKSGLPF